MFPYINGNNEYTSMRENYGHIIITKLGIVNPNTCFYQFVIFKYLHNQVYIVQLFIIDELDLYFNLKSRIAHMFCGWTFYHGTSVPSMLING